jgi:lipopolysaccharide transport periplasmic protein lptA
VTVSRNDKSEQLMKATGSPVKFSQELDGGKGVVNGQANTVTYSSAASLVTLTGNAKVQRGGDVAEGAVITYNTKTEVYTINGSAKSGVKSAAKSGRVSVVIQPSSTQKNK